MQRLLLALLATGTAATLAAGCKDSSSPGTLAGTYALQSVNSEALPATLAQLGGNKLEAAGGALVLDAGGTFSLTTELRITDDGSISTETASETGEWEMAGIEITLRASDGKETAGGVNGTTVTLAISQVPWLYRK